MVYDVDFEQVRRTTITALFSDEELSERLVLKGGNALSLVYRFTTRSSFDVDFSIEGDLTDVPDAEQRIFRVLRDRFDAVGFVLLDEKLRTKPKNVGEHQPATWGGYEVSFKLMDKETYEALKQRPKDDLSRQALVIGSEQRRSFTVDRHLDRHR